MTKLVLHFDYELRSWYQLAEQERVAAAAAERARQASGSTSIRISKATSAALAQLAERIRQTIATAGGRFYGQRITPDQLLAALTAGELAVHAPPPAGQKACKPRRRKVHAAKGGRRKVHAKSARARAHAKTSTSAKRRTRRKAA